MIKNIILCDDHALLRNEIKNWIETHSTYKVTHEVGTWTEYKKPADCIVSTIAAIKTLLRTNKSITFCASFRKR